jgi:hypothetical protein
MALKALMAQVLLAEKGSSLQGKRRLWREVFSTLGPQVILL